jgi:hypothetical protein
VDAERGGEFEVCSGAAKAQTGNARNDPITTNFIKYSTRRIINTLHCAMPQEKEFFIQIKSTNSFNGLCVICDQLEENLENHPRTNLLDPNFQAMTNRIRLATGNWTKSWVCLCPG